VSTPLPFASKVALVTGGGKGLGASIARRFAAGGAKVAVTGRDAAALEAVARDTKALAVQADVTDAAAMARALARVREELGPVAILVHNAGVAPSAPLERTEDDVWEKTMAVNVTAAFRLARALAPEMARTGFGRIVNVASNAGLRGYAYTAAYCASKHALVGLTRALAVEFARTPVTFNAVCPGFLETEMTARTIETIRAKTGRSEADARKFLEDLSPQKRLVQVDEVAHVVAMLCDDAARGINGQAIAIDGGQVTSAQ
jgi:NAD(P)-dependent dehydrogenase (short-subunit alcohol dehydrogenase family)